jgi:methyltransferase (TIGR00027 family)
VVLHRASKTAIGAAVHRAAHQVFDAEPKILDDPIAVGLVPETFESVLRSDAARFQQPNERRLRANFVLRSRFAEDQLENAAKRGVMQYLVLGAGLDTFAYRQPDWARELTIVEIDHAASQHFKIASLESSGIAVPPNVRFLSIDFGAEAVADRFAQAPLDRTKPIFVSWLGVSQYLTHDAIAATLRAIAAWPAGTELVFTYMTDDWTSLDPEGRVAIETAEARSAANGEPWLSKLSGHETADLLAASGFARIEPLSNPEAKQRYFRDRPDNLEPAGGPVLVNART